MAKKENRFLKNHPPVTFDPTDLLRSGITPPTPAEEEEKTKLPEVPVVEESKEITPPLAPEEKEPVPAEPVVEVPAKPAPAAEKPAAKAAPKKKANSLKENLLGSMEESKPIGKATAFYLDADVIEAIDKLVEQYRKKDKKTSKSKIVNTILRGVLFDE